MYQNNGKLSKATASEIAKRTGALTIGAMATTSLTLVLAGKFQPPAEIERVGGVCDLAVNA